MEGNKQPEAKPEERIVFKLLLGACLAPSARLSLLAARSEYPRTTLIAFVNLNLQKSRKSKSIRMARRSVRTR